MADTPLIYGSYSSKMHPIIPDGETNVTHNTMGKDRINPDKIFEKFINIKLIKKIKIDHYNAINGINIYQDTGYLIIITTDNQRIEVRDIAELNDLRHVISKIKNTEILEDNQWIIYLEV